MNEEEVASATKAYFAFEKELKEAVPREQRTAFKPCEVTGAVVDGKPLDPVSKGVDFMKPAAMLLSLLAFLVDCRGQRLCSAVAKCLTW